MKMGALKWVGRAASSAVFAGGIALVAALPVLADNDRHGQNTLDPAGSQAAHIRDLWYIILIPAMIVLILVGGAICYAAFRYRERDAGFIPKQVGGNNAIEFTWTLIPALILLFLFAISMPQVLFLRHSPQPEAMTVKVTGRQFSWGFTYPGIKREQFNVLYIPAGQVVNLDITSKDVIHSWSVPRLGGRLDAVPGQHNADWIEADQPGDYYGQCTELCGTGHASMAVTVRVLSKSAWEAWYNKLKGQ
jgi:cytochrome c oxidase subunit 2